MSLIQQSSRGAVSLTPWLQPGDNAIPSFLLSVLTVYSLHRETVETVNLLSGGRDHRAEATVLMKPLRVDLQIGLFAQSLPTH
jgi:hypothetical protein